MKLGIHTPHAITAAIFDFDETIIDLEPEHSAASAGLCREMGSDYFSLPETFRLSSGRRILDEVREMREHFGWRQSIDELMAIRQRHFRDACERADLQLLPCAADVVRALHAAGMPLAIATSAVGDEIDAILRRTALRDQFSLIVDGAQVTRAKPDPEAYRVTAAKLGVAAETCIVFEDSTVGVLAAKRAGATCIAIRNRRAHFAQDLSAADLVLDSFCELDVESITAKFAR